MSAAQSLPEVLAALGSRIEIAEHLAPAAPLVLGWAEVDAILPSGGLPRGVVELAAPSALGGATSVALVAIRAAHAGDARSFCAWIDPEGTLYAPGVRRAGVDLARLLVVRPPREELGRIAVKVAASGAFDVIVVDMDPLPFAERAAPRVEGRKRRRKVPPEVLVRKLALAAEEGGATLLLLTDSTKPRPVPWPVALRLELERPNPHDLVMRVAKDRHGRIGVKKTIPFASRHSCKAGASPPPHPPNEGAALPPAPPPLRKAGA